LDVVCIQSRGTGRIGRLFGPVMLVWFSTLALLGITHIAQNPGVLVAINPLYAFDFIATDGLQGFLILGTIFLVVTGGEALYADMGHFGRKPIAIAWFALVLPALLINYQYNGVIAERVVLVTVIIEEVPHVGDSRRVAVEELGQGFVKVTLCFGFMEEPNVPVALRRLKDTPEAIDPDSGPFFISRTKVIPSDLPGMALWCEQIYAVMQRNAVSAADFFRLPPTRVVEIGTGVEM
jgi:K+ transporter